jgi:hypothetical protein
LRVSFTNAEKMKRVIPDVGERVQVLMHALVSQFDYTLFNAGDKNELCYSILVDFRDMDMSGLRIALSGVFADHLEWMNNPTVFKKLNIDWGSLPGKNF